MSENQHSCFCLGNCYHDTRCTGLFQEHDVEKENSTPLIDIHSFVFAICDTTHNQYDTINQSTHNTIGTCEGEVARCHIWHSFTTTRSKRAWISNAHIK